MPTPKRPSARCAEGLSFCPGMSSPKDGGDDGAGTASIRCGDGERSAAGWDRTGNRMEGRRSGDGAVLRGERPIFRHSSLCRRSSFRPVLSGIWQLVSRSDRRADAPLIVASMGSYGNSPVTDGAAFSLWRDGTGIPWGVSAGKGGMCRYGIDTARRWRAACGRVKLHDERDGVCSVGDGGSLGRDRSRCVLGQVQRMHGNIHPCCLFGTDMPPETSMCSAIRFDCFFALFLHDPQICSNSIKNKAKIQFTAQKRINPHLLLDDRKRKG